MSPPRACSRRTASAMSASPAIPRAILISTRPTTFSGWRRGATGGARPESASTSSRNSASRARRSCKFLGELDARGIKLPVTVGLAGPATPATLTKFALRCGIGNSMRALRGQIGRYGRLLVDTGPDEVMRALRCGAPRATRRPSRASTSFRSADCARRATGCAIILPQDAQPPHAAASSGSSRTRKAAPDCRPGSSCGSPASGAHTGSWLSSRPSSIWNSGVTSVILLAGRGDRIRMRPVGAPDDAVGVGRDQRLRERRGVGIVGRELRGAVGAGDLHIGLAGFDEFDAGRQSPAGSTPSVGLRAAEMIEHDRHRRGGDQILDRRDHRQRGVELHMPAARLHALDRGLRSARVRHWDR